MSPVLENGDRVLISNPLLTGKIKRFDIVVIIPPRIPGKKLIKRIIGLPGEVIEIKNGNVMIDHCPLSEPFLKEKGDVMFRSLNMDPRKIPSGSYFLLGDHREKSTDSRKFGPLNKKSIVGKILFRYWPFKRIGILH